MKRSLTTLLLCALVCSAGLAVAQTVSNGTYYVMPSWDQTLPSSTRFVVLANWSEQAVLDRETGLVWQRAVNPDFVNWAAASQACINSTSGGRRGWRLPSLQELMTLWDPATNDVVAGHPFIIDPNTLIFWTATRQRAEAAQGAYVVRSAGIQPTSSAVIVSTIAHAWCVRAPDRAFQHQ